jgi:hypothetical protein
VEDSAVPVLAQVLALVTPLLVRLQAREGPFGAAGLQVQVLPL